MAAGGSRRRFLCAPGAKSLQVLCSAVQCSGGLVRPMDAFEARSRGWLSNFVSCQGSMAVRRARNVNPKQPDFFRLAVVRH